MMDRLLHAEQQRRLEADRLVAAQAHLVKERSLVGEEAAALRAARFPLAAAAAAAAAVAAGRGRTRENFQ